MSEPAAWLTETSLREILPDNRSVKAGCLARFLTAEPVAVEK
jgi:hypothetical protein